MHGHTHGMRGVPLPRKTTVTNMPKQTLTLLDVEAPQAGVADRDALAQLHGLPVQLIAARQPCVGAREQPVVGPAPPEEALDVDALDVGARAAPQEVLVDVRRLRERPPLRGVERGAAERVVRGRHRGDAVHLGVR